MIDYKAEYVPVAKFWNGYEGWKFCADRGHAILTDSIGNTLDWVRVPEGVQVESVISHHQENTNAWKYAVPAGSSISQNYRFAA